MCYGLSLQSRFLFIILQFLVVAVTASLTRSSPASSQDRVIMTTDNILRLTDSLTPCSIKYI